MKKVLKSIFNLLSSIFIGFPVTMLHPEDQIWGNKRNNFKALIIIISTTLICLLALQFYWTHESLLLANQQFNHNVRKSFHQLNEQLEKKQVAHFFSDPNHNQFFQFRTRMDSFRKNRVTQPHINIDTTWTDTSNGHTVIIQKQFNTEEGERNIDLKIKNIHEIEKMESILEEKSQHIEEMIVELFEQPKLFRESINLDSVDIILQKILKSNGIYSNFDYQIISHRYNHSESLKLKGDPE